MKKLPLLIILLFSSTAFADGPVIDPTITPTWTVVCNAPLERTNGDPLAIGDIARFEFKVSTDIGATKTWQPAGQNLTECKQVYDLTSVPDGQYYYSPLAVDTDGRQSAISYDVDPAEVAALVVKRIANPNHPNGVTGTAS